LLVAAELGRTIAKTPLARTVESRAISQPSALTVELQTIEVHETGCVASLRCLAGPELGMRSGHSGFIAVVEISDERRTSYEVQSGLSQARHLDRCRGPSRGDGGRLLRAPARRVRG
jgi:hypothetical protein